MFPMPPKTNTSVSWKAESSSQEDDLVPPPRVDDNRVKNNVFAYIRSRETRYLKGLENGDDEIADFRKCSTFKEMKEFIVAAAVIRNVRLELAKLKSQHERMWRGQFQALTRKQQQMLWKDFDQEA